MKLIKLGSRYYNPKYIVYIKQNDSSDTQVTVGCLKSWGFTESINLAEAVQKLKKLK